jgi:hypothetical protein
VYTICEATDWCGIAAERGRSRRSMVRSARLPTSIEPISSPSPSARAPLTVAIRSTVSAGMVVGP